MKGKLKIGVLAGGRSAEHEISLISAMNIIASLDRERYEPVVIAVGKDGKWFLQDEGQFLSGSRDPRYARIPRFSRPVAVIPGGGVAGQLIELTTHKILDPLDAVFSILHGPFGEDGSMQGLLKQLDIPFVGPSILGSAIGMDKEVVKRLLTHAGISNSRYVAYRKAERGSISWEETRAKLGDILFIKPANLGSSVGISKVRNEQEFNEGVRLAFEFDDKILIEENIKGREIEVAVLGNESVLASVPGEVIPVADFYSYEAKYIDDKGAILEAPAKNLDEATIRRIQATAVQTFQLLECEGMSRVDFFLKENGELYVNEINTLPGFTRISMYPRLWELSGIAYAELLDRLIRLAIERHAKEKALSTAKAF